MLRAITFDLWETLIHEKPGDEPARRDLRLRSIAGVLRRHGLDPGPTALESAHHAVWLRMEDFWRAGRDLSTLDQTRIFLEFALAAPLGGRLTEEALREAADRYADPLLHFPPRRADGAPEALADARRRGLAVGLICNTGRTPGRVLREILARLDLRDAIDAFYFSDELLLCKPDPGIFRRALAGFGVRPDEAIHVGDRIDLDLAGARAAGIAAVHLRAPGALEAPPGAADHVIPSLRHLPSVLDLRKGPP
jgi:putative hydrolase of the HAD superfamily